MGKGVLIIPAKVIASCFALAAFAAALLIGLVAGNQAFTILWRATLAMGACWFIGWVVGSVLQRTIELHIEKYKMDHPIEDDHADEGSISEVLSSSPAPGQATHRFTTNSSNHAPDRADVHDDAATAMKRTSTPRPQSQAA